MKAFIATAEEKKVCSSRRGKQDASLRKGVGTRFAISLMVVLLAVYVAFEWKSYEAMTDWDISMHVDDLLVEQVPVTKIELKLPPPPAAPDVIEIAPDERDIIDTELASTEPDPDYKAIDVADIVVEKPPVEEVIPFEVIEEVPVFPGCEGAADKRACFNEMMKKHISRHFQYPEIAQELGIQGRVSVLFTIQKDGSIGNIRLRGPDKSLEADALRIIEKLPRMTPGRQRGIAVRVPFSLPIVYRLQ